MFVEDLGIVGYAALDSNSNTVVFHVKCERNFKAAKDKMGPEKPRFNSNSSQEKMLGSTPKPANPDILLAKLRLGQRNPKTVLSGCDRDTRGRWGEVVNP